MKQSHFSGDLFPVGRTEVSYVFIDGADNEGSCNFSVVIKTSEVYFILFSPIFVLIVLNTVLH